ncbi:MAG: hypothetical protein ACFB14_24570 [Leptolyngbyaceae cyanobacterium]
MIDRFLVEVTTVGYEYLAMVFLHPEVVALQSLENSRLRAFAVVYGFVVGD